MSRLCSSLTCLALLLLAACGDDPAHPVPAWADVSPEQIATARKHGVPVAFENALGMRFVLIPSGTFPMGSPKTEEGREGDETRHAVTLTRPFYMQIDEVSNTRFRAFRPGHDSGEHKELSLDAPEQPVVQVSHPDALAFADWLSEQPGQREYDLPTEAQWERACRAGTDTTFFWGDRELDGWKYANGTDPVTEELFGWSWDEFDEDDGHRVTAPVGSYLPNPWGLYDMCGNVWEWCLDSYEPYESGPAVDPLVPDDGFSPVVRGGAWNHYEGDLRSAQRHDVLPGVRQGNLGFRLVSPVPVPSD